MWRICAKVHVSLSIIYGYTLPQHEGKIMVSWQTFLLVCSVTFFGYVLFHVNLSRVFCSLIRLQYLVCLLCGSYYEELCGLHKILLLFQLKVADSLLASVPYIHLTIHDSFKEIFLYELANTGL